MKIISITLALLFFVPPAVSAPPRDDHGFRFVRVQYSMGNMGGGMGRYYEPPWRHDYPTAEENLYSALRRTTEIRVDGNYLILSLRDKRIFEYPFLYLCEPGFWSMDEEELTNVREYLLRGGFILFDDFRGDREWYNFEYNIKRIFPEKQMEELEPDHPIWSVYYDVDPIEAPSMVSGTRGFQPGKYDDAYYGMYDDKGRLMFLACFNQDIGDGWEWPNRNWNNESTIAFQMGINVIIYALTH
ncbi:MAG: DUF4159 domain-containing protein [bacterium]|nr:DUF4159 domain-containing protein [bacterium]